MADSAPATSAPAGEAEPHHYVNRSNWLRAAVLGANDGLLSTGSLMAGVAAAAVPASQIVLTGVAGIVAGAMSMAAGEYVSVSSQADIERADRERERAALAERPKQELKELAGIYRQRGLDGDLACAVAKELTGADALAAHMRDELGVTEASAANPLQAALASAVSFVSGGIAPLVVAVLFPGGRVLFAIAVVTLVMLVVLGTLGARLGGAPAGRGVVRVAGFGMLAMAITALAGRLFHAVV